jgi:hypothetical protein
MSFDEIVELDKNFQVASADIFNITCLSVGLYQLYHGIEIAHPVFKILFCNLSGSLVASILNVFAALFMTTTTLITLINSFNITYLMFHCCCWAVLSILRFIYINHRNWLDEKYPEPRIVSIIAILSIFLIYISCLFFITTVALLHGWPRIKVYEMPLPDRAICAGAVNGTFFVLICISCSFYLLIIRAKKKFEKNKVAPLKPKTKKELLELDASSVESNAGDLVVCSL